LKGAAEPLGKVDSIVIAACSYAAFLVSLVELAVSALRFDALQLVLYAVIYFSISMVMHTYSRKLCIKCPVRLCPFNPKHR